MSQPRLSYPSANVQGDMASKLQGVSLQTAIPADNDCHQDESTPAALLLGLVQLIEKAFPQISEDDQEAALPLCVLSFQDLLVQRIDLLATGRIVLVQENGISLAALGASPVRFDE